MKKWIIILGLFISGTSFSQLLQENPWHISEIIGADSMAVKEFTLEKADTTKKFWMWGNTIKFLSDGTFKCGYAAKCGNDCFSSSIGNYIMIDADHISLFLKQYDKRGDCATVHRIANLKLGDYIIVKNQNNIVKLIKQN